MKEGRGEKGQEKNLISFGGEGRKRKANGRMV